MGDSGLFGPGTVTWTVNRELVLLAGGGRALLLQVAHPLVAAGVEQHSDYRRDPWGRLYRTLDLTTKIAFGDAEVARRAADRVRGTHGRVHGVSAEGMPYDARDPALLTWVWATLVDTALLVYQRAVRPLAPGELARYHAEQVRFAEAFGVPPGYAPADPAAFRAYWERMVAEELRVTAAARAVARSTLSPPGCRRRRGCRSGRSGCSPRGCCPRRCARATGSAGAPAGRARCAPAPARRGRCSRWCRRRPASSRPRGRLAAQRDRRVCEVRDALQLADALGDLLAGPGAGRARCRTPRR